MIGNKRFGTENLQEGQPARRAWRILMLVGDLCLSVIPASQTDDGLFMREAYLDGSYETWRLPLLFATGLLGMSLAFFTVRVSYRQIKPEFRKTRLAVLVGGVVYMASAGALHFFIGSLADWTSTLSPLLGRDETAELIQAQYTRIMPAAMIGLYDLTPALCHLDYTMSEAGGATDFVREYTLASGGAYCDCGYKRKRL